MNKNLGEANDGLKMKNVGFLLYLTNLMSKNLDEVEVRNVGLDENVFLNVLEYGESEESEFTYKNLSEMK